MEESSTTEGRKHWRQRQEERNKLLAENETASTSAADNTTSTSGGETTSVTKTQDGMEVAGDTGAEGGEGYSTTENPKDLQWQEKHMIDPGCYVPECFIRACHWVSPTHIALCSHNKNGVMVFEVTTTGSRLAFKLKCANLNAYRKTHQIRGAVMSDSLPGSLLVINGDEPYVYQFPCQESTEEIARYKIESPEEERPWCIVANATVAVVKMHGQNSFIVFSLPEFTQQSKVETSFEPFDLSISRDYLLLMGEEKMAVRSLSGDRSEDICEMELPEGCTQFSSVSFRGVTARELYIVCNQEGVDYGVYKYVWDGEGKPAYVNTGCIIHGLGDTWFNGGLSVTDEFMAVKCHHLRKVMILRLEEQQDAVKPTASANQGDDLQWHEKHMVDMDKCPVWACHWIKPTQLAVCTYECVKVFSVTTSSCQLDYTVTSEPWIGKMVNARNVAVSESLPDSMLVICHPPDQPYVYQFPCHETKQEVKKHKVASGRVHSLDEIWCIAANAQFAAVGMNGKSELLLYSLPEFTCQSHVKFDATPNDLSISSNYLLVMSEENMVVRSLVGNTGRDLCKIDCTFARGRNLVFAACFRDDNPREVYCVECDADDLRKLSVIKYVWNGEGEPMYEKADGPVLGFKIFRNVGVGCLAASSSGWMAVGGVQNRNVKLYHYE